MSQQSLLKIPAAISLLGYRVCPGDTPCLTSGRPKPTPKEAPVSILAGPFLACHAVLPVHLSISHPAIFSHSRTRCAGNCFSAGVTRRVRDTSVILKAYVNYYNVSRPHLSLERNAPTPRSVEPPALCDVVAVPQVGGLH